MGTNIVGDVYIGGGFLSVVILFFFLGYITGHSFVKIKTQRNIYGLILYMTLLSNSVFMCRGSYFIFLKNFVWLLVIQMLLSRKYENTNSKRSV